MIEPVPPAEIATRKKKVSWKRKKSSRTPPSQETHRPPAMPAKNAEITKPRILWYATLTPIACAVISSSRMACIARPYDEYFSLLMTNTVNARTPNVHQMLLPNSLVTPGKPSAPFV